MCTPHGSCFWPRAYFRTERSNAMFWSIFVSACCFFWGLILQRQYFFSVSSARDAQIIFRSLAIILLDVLAIGFLLFAHHCSLFAVRWLWLAARFLFLTNARWSFVLRYSPLARSFPIAALLSLVAAAFSLIASLSRYTLLMTLQPARLSLPVNHSKSLTISHLAFFSSAKGPSWGPQGPYLGLHCGVHRSTLPKSVEITSPSS